MNYMEQVAHMLGVELEEEFKLKDGIFKTAQDDTAKISKDEIFKITKDGMYGMFNYSEYSCDWNPAHWLLSGILRGRYEIVKKPILDEAERRYLKNVIKPFRDEIVFITKSEWCKEEYITIAFKKDEDMNFPYFEKNTMYKGMEIKKEYTLDDLGL